MTFEKDIERKLVAGVETLGGLCFKIGQDGWPDRLVVLEGGRVVWVELKRPTGRLSALQRWRSATLRRLGHRVETLWDKEDVQGLLEEWKRKTTDTP